MHSYVPDLRQRSISGSQETDTATYGRGSEAPARVWEDVRNGVVPFLRVERRSAVRSDRSHPGSCVCSASMVVLARDRGQEGVAG